MKEQINKEIIKKIQGFVKSGIYEDSYIKIPIEQACNTGAFYIFDILDLGLELLAVRAQNGIIEVGSNEIESPEEKRKRNMNKIIDWYVRE